MQGTILIIDGVATNRIMLKVQLSAAYYQVVQADGIDGLLSVARRCRPDLVLTAMSLPDGQAADVRAELARDETLAGVPVIAICGQNDGAGRLGALAAGIDDVLLQPLDDVILQARIRSLIRTRSSNEELQHEASQVFSMPLADSLSQAQIDGSKVALVTHDMATAMRWRERLKTHVPYELCAHQIGNIQPLMSAPVADIFVVELNEAAPGPALRLVADLRARAATRQSVVIAIPNPAEPLAAAEALDRGAHDVMQSGFDVEELTLRLATQLQNKLRSDQLRSNVRNGLRAAVEDPMTGLYNRRYAQPFLERVARHAEDCGETFAVMLADLDHFKRINDRFGHPAGDAVLIETAKRLLGQLRPVDLLARVGGEEFMIVMPGVGKTEAGRVAARLCAQINATPFSVPGIGEPIHVTTSIGAVIGGSAQAPVDALIQEADRALYRAKDRGRNQVTLCPEAA